MLAWRNHYVNEKLTAMAEHAARELDGCKWVETCAADAASLYGQIPLRDAAATR